MRLTLTLRELEVVKLGLLYLVTNPAYSPELKREADALFQKIETISKNVKPVGEEK